MAFLDWLEDELKRWGDDAEKFFDGLGDWYDNPTGTFFDLLETADTVKEYASGSFQPIFDKDNPPTKGGLIKAIRNSTTVDPLDLTKATSILNKNNNAYRVNTARQGLSFSSSRLFLNGYKQRGVVNKGLVANAIGKEVNEYPNGLSKPEYDGNGGFDVSRAKVFRELENNYNYESSDNRFKSSISGLSSGVRIKEYSTGKVSSQAYTWLDNNNQEIYVSRAYKCRVELEDAVGNSKFITVNIPQYTEDDFLHPDKDNLISLYPDILGQGGYYCRYTLPSKPGRTFHWFHNPLAESLHNWRFPVTAINRIAYADQNKWEPFIPLRVYWLDVNQYPVATATESVKEYQIDFVSEIRKYLTNLGLDLDNLTDQVNTIPDYNEITHIYYANVVDLKSEEAGQLKLMFEFFLEAYLSAEKDQTKVITETTEVKFEYLFDQGINLRDKTENFGEVGSVEIVQKNLSNGKLFLKKQLPGGIARYIYVPKMKFKVTPGNGRSTNFFSFNNDGFFEYTLKEIFNSDDVLGFIPLDHKVAQRQLSNLELKNLYEYSGHLIYFTTFIQYLEWYETEFFMMYIEWASVIIAIGSMNPEALTWSSVITAALTKIAIDLSIEGAIDEWGEDAAIVLIIAAIAAGSYEGSLEITSSALPAAVNLIDIINVTLTEYQESLQEEIEGLGKESREFQEIYETKLERLMELKGLLNPDGEIDLLYALQKKPVMSFNEQPNAFIKRAKEKNPGPISLRALHQWHDGAVSLPLPNDLKNKFV